MILTPMHSPRPYDLLGRLITENKATTMTCWSTIQKARSADGGFPSHMQGCEVGKLDDVTACGIHIGHDWDFDAQDCHPSKYQGCIRCESVYRKWAVKQKKVSTDNE